MHAIKKVVLCILSSLDTYVRRFYHVYIQKQEVIKYKKHYIELKIKYCL